MRILKFVGALVAVAVMSGCAHVISLSPDMNKISPDAGTQPIDANVAYYIPDDVLNKDVTTPGGGGDKVKYKPYKDLEAAFYKMLTNVFMHVTKTTTPTPPAADNVKYVIKPEITTTSSSPSAFTWPPTKFTTDLTCVVTDGSGKPVTQVTVSGDGASEFSEFKSNLSLTAQRSTEATLLKMQSALLAAPALRQ